MKINCTELPDLIILEPEIFEDNRGYFFESYNEHRFCESVGAQIFFVQENHSRSTRNVLRGLHYQLLHPQGKLVRVTSGEIFDVAVDIRKRSATFGKWFGLVLSDQNFLQLWVPEGFAHGFLVLSESADIVYKTTDYYIPEQERAIVWDDDSLNIDWPLRGRVILSEKDQSAPSFREAEYYR